MTTRRRSLMIDYSSISTKPTTSKLREHICNTRACIVALVLALVAVAGFLSATWYLNSVQFPQAEPTLDLMDYFVRVEGGRFVVGPECSLMYISGWNQWETVEAAAGVLRLYGASLPPNITGQELIKRKLQTAKEVGFNVVRAWANPVSLDYTLMEAPGVYNENMFRGLDFFLDEARKSGVRVILSLFDNWQEAGGIPHFQTMINLTGHEDFFFEQEAWHLYTAHVKAILTRQNSINGRLYKDDPTIFSWELINEPRCQGCPSFVLQTWITSMASYVKAVDKNHLVTVGEEGFFSNETPQQYANPSGSGSWAGDQGQNFRGDHSSEYIDYAGIHMWIQNWEDATPEFAHRWLDEHIRQARQLGKPLIMSEFGAWGSSKKLIEQRDAWYKLIYDILLEDAKQAGPIQGGLFWQWFGKDQKAPEEEGDLPGGIFGVFENDKSFDIARNFTAEIQKINNEYSFGGSCHYSVDQKAKPVHECKKTWVRGIRGSGYEGVGCNINVNECARGIDDCDENAACIDTSPGFICVCYAGFKGNGKSCTPNPSEMQSIRESFKSQGPGQLACREGTLAPYKPGIPGYMYDGTVSYKDQPVMYDTSTMAVTPEQCMVACRMMGDDCNSFSYDAQQMLCSLRFTDSVDICPQPPSYCVAIRGEPFECSQFETYFDVTKFSEDDFKHQQIKKRQVQGSTLQAYLDAKSNN